MALKKTLVGILLASSLAYADPPSITSISYDGTRTPARVTLTYTSLPTNTHWRVEYNSDLVNGSWKAYAYDLTSGGTNKVVLASPDAQRFFRLKQQ